MPVTPHLEDALNVPARERLRLLRILRGRSQAEIHSAHPGTLQKLENHDISSLTVGRMAALGDEYDMGFREMFDYLFPRDPEEARSVPASPDRYVGRLVTLLRTVGEHEQRLVCEQVRAFVEYLADTGELRRPPRRSVGGQRPKGVTARARLHAMTEEVARSQAAEVSSS